MDNSYKQKKEWKEEFYRKFGVKETDEYFVPTPFRVAALYDFIDETEKQAQSEMREDALKIIDDEYAYWNGGGEYYDNVAQAIRSIKEKILNLNKIK